MRSLLAAGIAAGLLGVQDASLPKEWNQAHGNAANSAFVDVAPLKAQPVERWRIESEAIVAGPVIAQQKLFVVARQKGKTRLLAIEPSDGKLLASVEVTTPGDVIGLAANEGLALISATEAVQAWRLSGAELRAEKAIQGAFGGEPAFFGATPLVAREAAAGLQTFDWAAGKAATLTPKGFGRAGVCLDDRVGGKPARTLAVLGIDAKQDKLLLQRLPIASSSPLKLGAAEVLWSGPTFANPERTPFASLLPVQGKDGADWMLWLDEKRGGGFLRKDGYKPLKFTHAPAIVKNRLYGFLADGRLVQLDATDDSETKLTEKEELHRGAQLGAPSIARDTLFLGNWALDLDRKRVLWCLETIEADGPAIPAGDELLVIRTKSGALIGYGGDAAAAGGAPPSGATGIAAAATSSKVPVSTELPGSKPGLIRSDGLFIPGKATALDGGRWRLEPESGAPQEFDAYEVALVDDGKEIRWFGDELPLFRAFFGLLERRHAESLVAVFEKWRDAKLPDECRRVLDEAKRHGLPPARADELAARLASVTAGKGGPPRKSAEEFEVDAREQSGKALLKAARWCAAREAKTAATVLLARAIALSPAEPPDLMIAEEWLPADLPPAGSPEANVKSWFEWAEAFLPSGASFANLDDSAKHRISVTKFAEGALYLRTRNLLLVSKEHDRAVLGPLLARGEATVRALQKILGPSPDQLPSRAPLEVRLFKTRKEYLDDFSSGSKPPAWSGGFYSPGDSISRFFSEVRSKQEDPTSQRLQEVFAHELTHHYTNQRWIHERRGPNVASHWMIEGFAEFAGGQALEIGRYGDKFADPTVEALDRAAAAARAGKLLSLDYLLGIDAHRFHSELDGGAFGPLRLKHTLTDAFMDKRLVFYEQSAALTFFVMNRCKDGRATYLRWLEQVYKGKALVEPWKDLGFADCAALDRAFAEFLAGI